MYRSENNMLRNNIRPNGFSLLEVMVAISVLAAISSSVLVVMNRCIAATIDSRTKMQAFELVRQNMEKVLGADSVTLMSEWGVSDTNPDIQWQTVVETFNPPVGTKMWLQAVCSATYTDSNGEKQTIELTHWLTELSDRDKQLIQKQREKELEYMQQYGLDEFGFEQSEQFGPQGPDAYRPTEPVTPSPLIPLRSADPCVP
jgi:prepilin-type N-terminal cleavage/methylation domain-containing protein